MTRWKVAQHVQYRFWLAYPASYDSEQPESNMDDDLPSQPLARGFRKWQDAMAYADRMARTVEVVLPRITGDREEGITEWPNLRDLFVWPDQHDEPRLGQLYLRIADDYRDVDVELHDLRPLAGVLLAYAEQEGV